MRFFLLFLFFFSVSAQTHAQNLIVLQYHHVANDTPSATSVTPEMFARHLQLIKEEKMTVVDLEDAIHALFNGDALPERAVAITFDDAYQSIYDNAFPLLRKRHWPFTVFVSTDAIDHEFPDMMTWEQLRDLYSEGAVIANHSVDHPYLIAIPEGMSQEEYWEEQIIEAEKRIFDEIGDSPKLFAYPYGEYTLTMINWLAEQKFIAFGQQSGPIGPSSHPQLLPRFPASGSYANIETLRTKLNSLAFSINKDQVKDPVLTTNPPTLNLSIPLVDIEADQVECFAAGAGKMELTPKESKQNVNVKMEQEGVISTGRGRYNCTAPSKAQPGRFYWYSQLWINSDVKNR